MNRLSSHFMFMGAFGIDSGLFGTSFTYAFREREWLQDVFEEVSGDRLMYAYFRVGGLAWEVPDNFTQRAHEVLLKTQQGIRDLDDLMTRNEIFMARCQNVGNFRGAGHPYDHRPDPARQRRHDLRVTRRTASTTASTSCPAGITAMFTTVTSRARRWRVDQHVEQAPGSPLRTADFPRSRAAATPPGEIYAKVESPRGDWGVYLVSKGGDKPYRMKLRSPSFCNLAGLREMTVGQFLADAVMILGSLDIVLCDVDR
jgi:NADH-quinone oxidoreductase subunit D